MRRQSLRIMKRYSGGQRSSRRREIRQRSDSWLSAASAAAEADIRPTDGCVEISPSDVNNTTARRVKMTGRREMGWEAENSPLCSCAGWNERTRTAVSRLSKHC